MMGPSLLLPCTSCLAAPGACLGRLDTHVGHCVLLLKSQVSQEIALPPLHHRLWNRAHHTWVSSSSKVICLAVRQPGASLEVAPQHCGHTGWRGKGKCDMIRAAKGSGLPTRRTRPSRLRRSFLGPSSAVPSHQTSSRDDICTPRHSQSQRACGISGTRTCSSQKQGEELALCS